MRREGGGGWGMGERRGDRGGVYILRTLRNACLYIGSSIIDTPCLMRDLFTC